MALKRERGSNKSNGLCKLAIDEELTIYAIDGLYQEISEEIELYERFELNLSEVEEIDSAGIQLLFAFNRELMRKDKTFKITSVSAPVEKLMTRYGINDRFKLGDVA